MIPKFRAWDRDRKTMHYTNKDLVVSFSDKGVEVIDNTSFSSVFMDIDNFELLQSTGLKDKNGAEIFEGDILKVGYGDLLGETRETLIIAKNPFEYSMEEAKFLDFSYVVEIIGNKYEHPHLIEE